MASPTALLGPIASLIGMGTAAKQGQLGVQAAQTKAAGDQINIEGQMLHTIGQAFQFDTQAQEYTFKSSIESYQQAVSLMNEQIAKENATYALRVGDVKAEEAGMQERYELGAMKASQASSGIDIGSGSSSAVRESMIEIGNYNQVMLRADAARTAYGYEVEATQDDAQAAIHTMQAGLDTMNAANATTAAGIVRQALPLEQQAITVSQQAAGISAQSSIVGAVGSVASKWLSGSWSGMFGGSGGTGTSAGGTTGSPGPYTPPVSTSTLGAGAGLEE